MWNRLGIQSDVFNYYGPPYIVEKIEQDYNGDEIKDVALKITDEYEWVSQCMFFIRDNQTYRFAGHIDFNMQRGRDFNLNTVKDGRGGLWITADSVLGYGTGEFVLYRSWYIIDKEHLKLVLHHLLSSNYYTNPDALYWSKQEGKVVSAGIIDNVFTVQIEMTETYVEPNGEDLFATQEQFIYQWDEGEKDFTHVNAKPRDKTAQYEGYDWLLHEYYPELLEMAESNEERKISWLKRLLNECNDSEEKAKILNIIQGTGSYARETHPTPPDSNEITYNALFTQEGEAFTLIADSITNSFLVLDNANKTIRPTHYKYISYFEELNINPILGSSGDLFVFLAHHEVIASDGKKEWVLTSVGEADTAEKMGIGYIVQNENRIMADIFSQSGHVLLIIDLNTAATYKFPNRVGGGELIVFADDSILFGEPTGNMTTGYYCTLYKVQGGEIETIGVIPRSDTYEYTLESNVVNIKLGDLSYRIDLESNQITSSVPVSDELRLYYPVFCNTTIMDLTEMKFIHNNVIQSIKLPDGWTSYCTYFGEKWFFGFEPKDANIRLIPHDGYFNRLEPYENRPIQKFPESAAVKEHLYSGTCFIGECEIYLLERAEPYNTGGVEQNIYEMIYAYIPYEDGLKAYELNIYVPLGESYEAYYTMMKAMLRID